MRPREPAQGRRDNDAGFFTDDLSPEALNQREPGSGQTPLMAASLPARISLWTGSFLWAQTTAWERRMDTTPTGWRFKEDRRRRVRS